jgi:hypothetical protein
LQVENFVLESVYLHNTEDDEHKLVSYISVAYLLEREFDRKTKEERLHLLISQDGNHERGCLQEIVAEMGFLDTGEKQQTRTVIYECNYDMKGKERSAHRQVLEMLFLRTSE